MTPFPFASADGAVHRATLPRAADVVVIGGGIAGINAAWHLVGQGLRVVLCEKGRVAAEQSGRNWGWVRIQGRDPAEIPLMSEAKRLWADWSARLGPDLGYRVGGVTYLAGCQAEVAEFEQWLTHARAHDLDSRMMTRAELDAHLPAATGTWAGAMITPSDARAEPFNAVPMMARAAVSAGVMIREHCAVRGLDIQAGRVVGVVTEAGRIRAESVVLAGGVWSSLLVRQHGVRLPQLGVRLSVAATQPIPDFLHGAAADPDFAIRRRADGGYTLTSSSAQRMMVGPDAFRHLRAFLPLWRSAWHSTSLRPAAPKGYPDAWSTPRHWALDAPSPFEAMRVLNPQPDLQELETARAAFGRAFPSLGPPALRLTWGGMVDTTPDVVPVLDHIPQLPGLVLGTGLSGHGFGIGPAIGRVLAALATGANPGHDLHRFRFSRFADGTPMRPGPAL